MVQHKELLSNIYCENVPSYTLYPKDLIMNCDLNLIIVQQDATYSVYYISVGSSTRFGC